MHQRCAVGRRLLRQGVSMAHLQALWILDEHGGALPVSRLADCLGIAVPNATGLVDRMEQRGLVERVHPSGDRRVVLVLPTGSAGRRRTRSTAGATSWWRRSSTGSTRTSCSGSSGRSATFGTPSRPRPARPTARPTAPRRARRDRRQSKRSPTHDGRSPGPGGKERDLPAPGTRDLPARPVRGPRRDPPRAPPGRARPDDRRDGPAPDRHRPAGQRPLHVGRHDLPADEHDHRARSTASCPTSTAASRCS